MQNQTIPSLRDVNIKIAAVQKIDQVMVLWDMAGEETALEYCAIHRIPWPSAALRTIRRLWMRRKNGQYGQWVRFLGSRVIDVF